MEKENNEKKKTNVPYLVYLIYKKEENTEKGKKDPKGKYGQKDELRGVKSR